MTAGTILREGHECHLGFPKGDDVLIGTIWRCSCGRRWIARTRRYSGALVWGRPAWPWPRAKATT